MEYHRTKNTLWYLKSNNQHCLVISYEDEIDNSGNLTLLEYKVLWELEPISREQFEKRAVEVMKKLNKFIAS